MTKANTSAIAKLSVAFVAVAMLFTISAPAKAATTIEELQAMIASLTAQIAALTSGSTATAHTFTTSLTIGATGADVTALQNYLIGGGYSIPAGATGYFGAQTQAAVAAWQAANGVAPAVGYFGPISIAKYNSLQAAVVVDEEDEDMPSSDLEGTVGTIESTELVASLSSEEAGEGESDVEVAGLEIEAGDDSDIEVTAIKLDFDAVDGNFDDDLDEYLTDVTIWFNGDKVADVDADKFNDDNSYAKYVPLDSGVVIEAGEKEELIVAVSVLSSLDTDSRDDSWTVDFTDVRYRDAADAITSEDITEDAVTFNFATFASASDLEVKVSKGDDSINDTQTVKIDESDDTDGVEILSFEIEVEGNSDITIDDIPVNFTATGAGVGEIINRAMLYVDGDLMTSETVASSSDTTTIVTFDNLNWDIDAGDTVEVIVKVDVNDLDGGFTAGDSLYADVDHTESGWDIEDEEGEDVDDSDKSGTATSEDHTFYAEGLHIVMVSDSATDEDATSDAAGGETGLYTVTFKVTAFGDDIYVPLGWAATSTLDADDGVLFVLEDSNGDTISTGTTTAVVASDADTSGSFYVIEENQEEEFELTVTYEPTADGYYRLQLYGVGFNVGEGDDADTVQQALPTEDFETSYVNIDV